MQTKYIFVTGGVVSGLGKGITAASLGRLLKARGMKITIQKFDPYINFDPGTMNPYEHGEVFVTEDGAETDLDIGHYERFIDANSSIHSNTTAGKIYWSVIHKERRGEYLGETVQVIPHITTAIKDRIFLAGKQAQSEIVITEIGGTVGDIESLPFLEAIRQVAQDVGRENTLYIHVTLIPYLAKSGEMKTKPSQHSVKELLSIGIQPDIIVCRTERTMSNDMLDKLSLFCNVAKGCVIQNIDSESLYQVPLLLENEGLAQRVCEKLRLGCAEPNLTDWEAIVEKQRNLTRTVNIALVGKYVQLHDAYLSIVEALNHAGIYHGVNVKITWVNAEEFEDTNDYSIFDGVDGILVPGGFGYRGVEGKIKSITYARENKVPFFGICLGMQCAVIEFTRNALNIKTANSGEFVSEGEVVPVIDIMPDQKDIEDKGGTMRLGAYPCKLLKDSLVYTIYNEELIYERHRHRFEFNNQYRNEVLKSGLKIAGLSPDERLVEIIELDKELHPWFVGVQFHPEFKSRPNRPHPLFREFVKAALDRQ